MRSSLRPARVLPALALALAAGCARPVTVCPQANPADDALRFVQEGDAQYVEAFDAGLAYQAALAHAAPDKLRDVLSVRTSAARSAMLGEYSTADRGGAKVLRFAPRFALTPGLNYVAVFDATPLGGRGGKRELKFAIPKPPAPPTEVEAVYPSADVLPENLLRVYVHFTAPMRHGEAYQHIRILGPDGQAVAHPFLELDEELWDASGKRLSILFDPGRVKRGLKSREEAGPVLEAGKAYTLVVGQGLHDANDEPLKQEYRKAFTAGPAEVSAIDPAKWTLTPPERPAGPLVVRFPRPLDHGLLRRVLTVADVGGRRVGGKVAVTDHERCWTFTPVQPWVGGRFELVVAAILEDVCGNAVGRPFEVDEQRPPSQTGPDKAVRLPFELKP